MGLLEVGVVKLVLGLLGNLGRRSRGGVGDDSGIKRCLYDFEHSIDGPVSFKTYSGGCVLSALVLEETAMLSRAFTMLSQSLRSL